MDISYINGERHLMDYDFRKKKFNNMDELEAYRKYLEKRMNKSLFFTYRQPTD